MRDKRILEKLKKNEEELMKIPGMREKLRKEEAEMERQINREMAEAKAQGWHQCTKKEAANLKKIIWKYFSKDFANDVLIAYGKRPGDSFEAYNRFWDSKEADLKNRTRARKEYSTCLEKMKVYGEDKWLSEEEIAIVFLSGMISPNQ